VSQQAISPRLIECDLTPHRYGFQAAANAQTVFTGAQVVKEVAPQAEQVPVPAMVTPIAAMVSVR